MVMTNEVTVTLPKLHPKQIEIVKSSKRFNVLDCGRRFGKTSLAVDRMVRRLLQGQRVAYCAPIYEMCAHVWGIMKNKLMLSDGMGRKLVIHKHETRLQMILANGAVFDCWSMEADSSMLGLHYDYMVIDEAAKIPQLLYKWEKTMRALLVDTKGHALFLSTPWGFNDFYTLWSYGMNGEKDWASWQMPSHFNPHLDPEELVDIERTISPTRWRQEYLAEFVDDAGGVFRGVRDVATGKRAEPYTGDFVVGVDWGKSNDWTVISVMDSAGREVDFDRFNQISWELQRGRLKAMVDKWKPRLVLAEANSIGEPNIEALGGEGLPIEGFMTTSASKAPLIDGLALAIERKHITLIDEPIATAELMAYTMERMAGGGWRYGAPQGAHDDSVIARALAWRACGMSPKMLEIHAENPFIRRR